jgi:hypothetical protein
MCSNVSVSYHGAWLCWGTDDDCDRKSCWEWTCDATRTCPGFERNSHATYSNATFSNAQILFWPLISKRLHQGSFRFESRDKAIITAKSCISNLRSTLVCHPKWIEPSLFAFSVFPRIFVQFPFVLFEFPLFSFGLCYSIFHCHFFAFVFVL